jgi:putative hydrolase of the HAD superfamily
MIKPKALFFDLFDTLIVYNRQNYHDYHIEMAQMLNLDPEQFITIWNDTTEAALAGVYMTVEERCCDVLRLLQIHTKENEALLIQSEFESLKNAAEPVVEIPELLHALHEQNQVMAIISNASCAGPTILKALEWEKFFSKTFFSFKVKLWKPDPQMFLAACHGVNVNPKEAAFISDGDRQELDGAVNAGLMPIRFDPTGRSQFKQIPSETIDCKTVADLKKILLY